MGWMGVFIRSGRLLPTVPKTAEPQTPGQHLPDVPWLRVRLLGCSGAIGFVLLSCPNDPIGGVVELSPSGEPPAPGHPVTAPFKGREVIGDFPALTSAQRKGWKNGLLLPESALGTWAVEGACWSPANSTAGLGQVPPPGESRTER